jgi:hypothetical protein
MSGPLAIAAVTAGLKDLLNNGLLDHDLSVVGSFSVTSSPPDRIATGAEEPNRLNLFLYQISANPGWRNVGMPARDGNGARLSNPPLALDLHYLLTAYGSQDLNAEILLGYAMQLLHENPLLSRDQLRTVLGAPSPVDGSIIPGIFGTLSAIDLADQVELIKISPNFLSADELSKMWTAMQARYRQSMAYTVSVVLIQATDATRAPLPVLRRGADDRGALATAAPFPSLSSVRAAVSDSLPAVRLGDDLLIAGSNLNGQGALTVILTNAVAGLRVELPAAPGANPGTVTVHLPSPGERPQALSEWAIGMINVALRVTQPGLPTLLTNSVPIALAPLVSLAAPADPAGYQAGEMVTLICSPRLQARQEAATQIIFGIQTLAPASIDTPEADPSLPTTLTFAVPAVAAGNYLVRLRVDGIDSLPVTASGTPPRLGFDPAQKVTVL